VKLFAIAWRGVGGIDPPSAVQYTFDHPFSVLSGFDGANVVGTTLSPPDGSFYDGILQFSGTFNSLAVTTNATLENGQAMTFDADEAPEPALGFLLPMGLTILFRFGMSRPRHRGRKSGNVRSLSDLAGPVGDT
jgi:hypothetical protein